MTLRRLTIVIACLLSAVASATASAGSTERVHVSGAGGAPFPHRALRLTLPPHTQLRAGQLKVTEDGQPVIGLSVLPATVVGAGRFGVVLVIDTSNSMRGAAIIDAMDAARKFADQRNSLQPLGLITFNRAAHVVLRPTTNQAAIDRALGTVPKLGEATRIYDAAAVGLRVLHDAGIDAGTLVVLSDGADTGSRTSLDKVVAAAAAAHVHVFTVGLRSTAYDPSSLEQLATRLNGAYTEANSSGALAPILASLGEQLAGEYLITYRSIADPDQAVRVDVQVVGLGRAATRYTTPSLPTIAIGPHHTSAAARFWQSPFSMLLIALLSAGLVAATLIMILRPRNVMLQRRMADFISIRAPKEEKRAAASSITTAVFEGAEKSLERTPWWAKFKEELEIADVKMPAVQVVLWTVVGTVFAIWILSLVTGSVLVSLLGLAVPFPVRAYLQRKLRKKREAFAEQLPDNLQVLASALRAGHSLVGALSVVVDESADPSKSEFRRVIADEQLGVPLERSLGVVVRRMDSQDLEQVALVATLQRRTGGNMAEVLDRVTETIRERFELRRLVKTLTAQGRMSRWILTFLPVGLVFVIALLNAAYMHPLLHTGLGNALLVVGALMVAAGSYVIKRIVEIKI